LESSNNVPSRCFVFGDVTAAKAVTIEAALATPKEEEDDEGFFTGLEFGPCRSKIQQVGLGQPDRS
jgi:hypothetical protein